MRALTSCHFLLLTPIGVFDLYSVENNVRARPIVYFNQKHKNAKSHHNIAVL